jgi:pSer/pThr/pTyr-binding forkhead associated (FHA) protein
LRTNAPGQPATAKATQPAASTARPTGSASPYRPTQRPPTALLTVFDDGRSEGEVLRLRADHFVIGRSEGDFLVPHDPQISARHLEITRHRVGEQYRWVLTDLQTTNGLFIRVSRTALADRAEFLVGTGRYRFEAPGSVLPETLDSLPPGAREGSTRALGTDAAALLQPTLVELAGGKVLSRLPLAKPEYWIGSGPDCAICRAGDPFVEPRHARLYRDANGAWHAQNNKSSNGLWVKVPQITVTDSCLFQIGEQRFRLNAGG